ncbi:hypothetical protein MBBWO_13870 [Methanobrevibacter woesei]|uniref:Uncharacterized protein n=1 Tax=Methanobrevibacter woesei TaxID=190976 RepID=A0A2U1S5X8_9EURY|nr:hypothetical protein MBBWO_13870 [Methanobrevibacter woesei]
MLKKCMVVDSMDDIAILNLLEKKSKNKKLFEFTKDIFFIEYKYERDWKKKYDKIIDKYI